MPDPTRTEPPERIEIQYPAPAVDGGRYPAKRCVGDTVQVSADIFRDGHDMLRALVRHRGPGGGRWTEAEMHRTDARLGGVRWAGEFAVDAIGLWEYTIEAWTDVFGTWRDELSRKIAAGQQDLAGELSEGIVLLRDALARTRGKDDRELIEHALTILEDPKVVETAKHDVAVGVELHAAVERHAERHGSTTLARPLPVEVDRLRARVGAWYELFPRSWGGFEGVEKRLPKLAELGFDVVYLPPIHPIGRTNRKGRNNAPVARSPMTWVALGHRRARRAATTRSTRSSARSRTSAPCRRPRTSCGIEIALDFAIQCSPDHPWLKEHPEWFHRRPDGTLKFAENPPKRYQDIYNVNCESEDWRGLWEALLAVVLHWVENGVKVFRVDNPHTKPFPFWEWLIARVHERDPRRGLPGRGVHPPLGDAPARQARLQPVLHLLHLEELAARAPGVRERAGLLRRGGVLPAELLRQHAGHPARVPPARRPDRPSRCGWCWPPR